MKKYQLFLIVLRMVLLLLLLLWWKFRWVNLGFLYEFSQRLGTFSYTFCVFHSERFKMYSCCPTPFTHHVNPVVLHCTYTSIIVSTSSYKMHLDKFKNSYDTQSGKLYLLHRLEFIFMVFPYWVTWQDMESGRKHCQGSGTESSVLVDNLDPSEEGRACCEGQLDAFTFCQAYEWEGLRHSAFHFQIKSTWSWSKHFYIFSGRSNKMIHTVIDKILRNKS